MDVIKILEKVYDEESLSDLERDVTECFNRRYNPVMNRIPELEKGTIKVTITFIPEED